MFYPIWLRLATATALAFMLGFGQLAAEEKAFDPEDQAKVLVLLKKMEYRTKDGSEAIKKLTLDLPLSYRLALRDSHVLDAGIGLGINFGLPSIGNWAMGNVAGGVVTSLIYLLGAGSLSTGAVTLGSGPVPYTVSISMIAAGCGLLAIEGLLNLVLPFAFADDMNNKLSEALGLGKIVTHSIKNPAPKDTSLHSPTKQNDGFYIGLPLLSASF